MVHEDRAHVPFLFDISYNEANLVEKQGDTK